jgi:tetratricopeptide (TPR) repeat protein
LGALDLTDLNAAGSYADTADSEARHLLSLGRVAEAKQLETEVYEIAEKVLLQRPNDLHALSDRSFAAELLGRLAARMHDSASALDYARRAALSGENEVRFNPADVGAWQRWSLALRALSDRQFDNGDIAGATATLRSVLALEDDKRRPSSLGPILWYHWIGLAFLEAETGSSAAASAAVEAFKRDAAELVAQLSAEDAKRPLLVDPGQGLVAWIQFLEGSSQEALTNVTAVIARMSKVETPAKDIGAMALRSNIMRGNYDTGAQAAIRLGRYRDAEGYAHKLLDVPLDPTSEEDPGRRTSHGQAVLAHAIAMQGRGEEALATLAPALAYYREQQRAGATDTEFRFDLAYALLVDALARSDSAAERAHRAASLDEATRVLDGASEQARQMASFRRMASLIAEARG